MQGRHELLSAKVWESLSESWEVCWGRKPRSNALGRRRISKLLTF